MDNFHIDVTSYGQESLFHIMQIIAERHKVARGYLVQPEGIGRLVFYWWIPAGNKLIQSLPFTLDAQSMTDFTRRWLAEVEYPEEPDHDGSNSRGFRVYNNEWGHVQGAPEKEYSMCAVAPEWAWHGK